jgi:ABC-type transport system substrate-binding protein
MLSAVVVFAVRGTGDRGQLAAETIDERTVRTAEESFCAKFGHYGTEQELVDAKLLSEASTYTDVDLHAGGTCGPPSDERSRFTVSRGPTADVVFAASADLWQTADGAEPGYRTSAFAYPLNTNLYDPLIIIGSDYTLQPGLAVSWEAIPVGDARKPSRPYNTTTWRFHLRQGVVFHDGSTFDADDVMWTWRDRQALNGVGLPRNSSLTTVTNTLGFTKNASTTLPPDPADSVEKIDQFTVDITPKVENLRLPEQIGHPKGAILPEGKHFDGSTGGLPAAPNNGNGGVGTPLVAGTPIGTGPFTFGHYTPGSGGTGSASVEANPAYWGTRAQVRSMEFEFILDPVTRTNKMLAPNGADLAIDLDPLAVSAVTSSGGRVVSASYGQNLLIYVNKVVKHGPGGTPKYDLTTDPAVRRAASLALDRDTFVARIYNGNAAPGRWMGPPNILGPSQSAVPALAYDPPRARTVLDDAGWTCGGGAPGAGTPCATDGQGNPTETRVKNGGEFSGRSLELRLIGNDISLSQTGYDLIKAYMKAVGINVSADRLTVSGRNAEYLAGNFDFDLELPNQNDANPAFLPTLRFACSRSNTFRFAPVDGTNGVGPAVAVTKGSEADGEFPYGNTPCTSPGAVLGPFDTTHVPGADLATTQAGAQAAAAQQMRILVGQDQTSVVIPVVGQFRIYGMRSNVNLGDPHPSQTSQRWVSLTKS